MPSLSSGSVSRACKPLESRLYGALHANSEEPALVEAMWQVAYADGALDANENHVISKVADLLHVTHGDYIAAMLRARDQRSG